MMAGMDTMKTEATSWDWRSELKTLDSALLEVERHVSWDWRRDLADLETRMEQLAQKYGLVLTSSPVV